MTARRRILMIAPHYEEYAYLLAVALAAHADVRLVLDIDVLDAEFARRDRPDADALTLVRNRFRTPSDAARLLAAVAAFRPDVVHWQEPSGFIKALIAATMVTAVKPFCGTAITIHDPVPHLGRDARVAARLATLRRYARARVDRIFLHGPACVRQYLDEYLGRSDDPHVRITTHGTVLTSPAAVLDPARPFRALMMGRMEAYKGLAVLTDALRMLADEGTPIAIDIAGDGPELDRLAPILEHVPGVVLDRRYVPAAVLADRIAAATCVILPYLEASQSGVAAAALANGRFVVASAVGGIADVIDDGNGILVPPGDPSALAGALRRVATDPSLCARLQEGAARTASTRLAWPRIARQLLADYPAG